MVIDVNTKMLLFRFSNYGKYSFINEHRKILNDNGYVWMLKLGKRSSIEKIMTIIKNGGWLVLRSPKACGGTSYLAKFSKISEEEPSDAMYPKYYNEILTDCNEEFYNPNAVYQWFKLDRIEELSEENAETLVISQTRKKVNEVIRTTRTAVMFIENDKQIEV